MKLAIADDHEVVRDGLRFLLESDPNIEVVSEASTAAEAIEILLTPDPPEILLLDLRMAGTSGFDVLDTAQRRQLPTRILILTMHDEPAHLRRALQLGASGYILKSGGRRELLAALDAVRAGKRFVQGDLAAELADASESAAALTSRERQILGLVADGKENKQIARELGLAEDTIKTYLRNLFTRWSVSSRAEAVATAIRLGIIE